MALKCGLDKNVIYLGVPFLLEYDSTTAKTKGLGEMWFLSYDPKTSETYQKVGTFKLVSFKIISSSLTI